jgi:hypothetical protein
VARRAIADGVDVQDESALAVEARAVAQQEGPHALGERILGSREQHV